MPLLHLSINAAEPAKTAGFLADLLGGEAMPFPPFPDSWIAFSERDDGTAIEVYPLTHRLFAGAQQVDCRSEEPLGGPTFVHAAIGSPLSRQDIMERARARGWTSRLCDRGPFKCVEIWLENRLLVEVLDPEMQEQYRSGMRRSNWRRMFNLP